MSYLLTHHHFQTTLLALGLVVLAVAFGFWRKARPQRSFFSMRQGLVGRLGNLLATTGVVFMAAALVGQETLQWGETMLLFGLLLLFADVAWFHAKTG